ncbi:MAG TPA: hypothetical protein QGF41_03810, partial [Gammaproteobacteria bacterium]|nr:hypothetical protein [Gammaproteobacteria bacterium]
GWCQGGDYEAARAPFSLRHCSTPDRGGPSLRVALSTMRRAPQLERKLVSCRSKNRPFLSAAPEQHYSKIPNFYSIPLSSSL